MDEELLAGWRAAPFAELGWADRDGRPQAVTVVPLVADGQPLMALTYDRLEVARGLADAAEVSLSVTSPMLNGGRTPTSATVQVEVREDPDGEEFVAAYLPQELAKHPPSRRYADSPLLCSEHRWYLPRLLVRATQVRGVREHAFRDALALSVVDGRAQVDTVDLDGHTSTPVLTSPLPDGPVAILQHGADLPDLELPWWRRWRGTVRAGHLEAFTFDQRPPRVVPPGVWRRWRDEVAFEKACRAGLASR